MDHVDIDKQDRLKDLKSVVRASSSNRTPTATSRSQRPIVTLKIEDVHLFRNPIHVACGSPRRNDVQPTYKYIVELSAVHQSLLTHILTSSGSRSASPCDDAEGTIPAAVPRSSIANLIASARPFSTFTQSKMTSPATAQREKRNAVGEG